MRQEHTHTPWVSNGRYVGVPNHKSMIAECRDKNGNWANDAMSLDNAALIVTAVNSYASSQAEIARLRQAAAKVAAVLTAFRTDGEIDMGKINRACHTLEAALSETQP